MINVTKRNECATSCNSVSVKISKIEWPARRKKKKHMSVKKEKLFGCAPDNIKSCLK